MGQVCGCCERGSHAWTRCTHIARTFSHTIHARIRTHALGLYVFLPPSVLLSRSLYLALSISLSFSFVQVFDYVICATGHFSVPNVPHFPGFESFEGRVLHAHDFRTMRHTKRQRERQAERKRGREG